MQHNDDSASAAQQHFETAASLFGQGRHNEAEVCCRDALGLAPDHQDALQLLAAIMADTGRQTEAERTYLRLVALKPTDAALHASLGKLRHAMGRYPDALSSLQRSLALKADSPETHIMLGDVFAALKRPHDALSSYRDALALDPNQVAAHCNAGDVLATHGLHEEAVAAFKRALERAPDAAAALNGLGNSLGALGRIDEAMDCFERAIVLQPSLTLAHYNLGLALAELERHDEAVAHFRIVIAEWPEHPGALFLLGKSLFASFHAAESLQVFERLLAIDPAGVPPHLGAAHALKALGRLEEARIEYERALALAPRAPAIHLAIADLKRFHEGDPQIQAMETLARDRARLPDRDRVALHFALAKAYDDLGRHKLAFEQLRDGNGLKRRMTAYDEAATLTYFRDIETVFSAELLEKRRGLGDPSERPVFVLGMPRSGTTLVEQIIASHPRAFGAGEQRHWLDVLEAGHAGERFPFDVATLPDEALRRLGSLYAERLKSHAPDAERVTDKLPANFRLVGLIHLALPKARIIHVRRDPMDTCFSCYAKLFANSLEYTCDLGELGRYYRGYDALMAHWRRVLPAGAMLEVQYEDLVSDFEAQARRIVEYCGLEWDERCLRFHDSERPIYTFSAEQVRQPLFQSSVGRWRSYAEWLAPLREALNA
ncbi:MAG: sulfotransferase [Alphaproteobacteria bacterium]|nr:sulfotransferase [Alphaproteobacteria bacterium]MDE2267077.1 sulfotransferase [Alphaproteobacteria bacterium]MDE2498728.1 sulfotransferase [Alphaproteobacteria bacterium]